MYIISSKRKRVLVHRRALPVGAPVELTEEDLAAIEATPGMSAFEVAAPLDTDPDPDATGGTDNV